MTTMAPADTRKRTTTSYGVAWDHSPATASSTAIDTHFTLRRRTAVAASSCERPFATQRSHTARSSGVVGGGTLRTDSTSTDAGIAPSLSSQLHVWYCTSAANAGIAAPTGW